MATKRKIEVFTAGCSLCDGVVEQVKSIACPSCEILILDMHDEQVSSRAITLGVKSVPAVAIDGKLADCCASRGVDLSVLKAQGIGTPI